MKRPLKPATESRAEYPTLAMVLRGAALAGGLLLCGDAAADASVPTTGKPNGNVQVIRPGGGPVMPVLAGKKQAPAVKGQMPVPLPPGLPPHVQPPQPEPPKKKG
jgi:hypothetical protein